LSYYTRVTFAFSEVEPPGVDDVSKIARAWLEAHQDYYAVDAVLGTFLDGWATGEALFKGIDSEDIEGLMASVSAHYPEIYFYVRGMGEDFNDVWLRQFKDGKTMFGLGPFDEVEE
jgi:hypothetical protein